MNLSKMKKSMNKLSDYLDTEERKKNLINFFTEKRNAKLFREKQIERFYEKYKNNMPELIDKILTKYDSEAYVKREHKLGYQPREPLCDVLFEIGKKYGFDITEDNADKYEKYLNVFTGEACVFCGYFMQLMHGQGSIIKIEKL